MRDFLHKVTRVAFQGVYLILGAACIATIFF